MPVSSVVLVALLAFALGVYVGRGLGPKASPGPAMSEAGQQSDVDAAKVLGAIRTSDNVEMLIGIGNEMFDARRPQLAIPAYEKALGIQPDNADVHTDLGIMYRDAGKIDQAIQHFQEAMRIDPRHENSSYNLGVVLLHNRRDFPGAIKACEDYLLRFPRGEHAQLVRDQLGRLKAEMQSK
jgi:tetratricopeptide (TPR) repeat protein